MRALLILAVCLVLLCFLPASGAAQDEDAGGGLSAARMLSFGLSMGASFLMGAIKKKALPRQGMRNAIPATNSIITGGTAGALTSDPYSALAAVGGSLLMSGVYSLQKRLRTGCW